MVHPESHPGGTEQVLPGPGSVTGPTRTPYFPHPRSRVPSYHPESETPALGLGVIRTTHLWGGL